MGSKGEISAIVAIPNTPYAISAGKEKFIRIWQKTSILQEIELKGPSVVCTLVVNQNMKLCESKHLKR